MPQGAARSPQDELDPIDRHWLERRSAVAPIVLGIVAVVLSPLLLGILFGPLALRAGVDLWRTGTRRAGVLVAILLGAIGTATSIAAAMLWGSVLASVLLGRDAMREAERWTGRDVSAAQVEFPTADGSEPTRPLAMDALGPDHERWAILFTDDGSEPCLSAAATLDGVAKAVPGVLAVVAAPREAHGALTERFMREGIRLPIVNVRAVPPLDAVAALPTLVVVNRSGRVEKALVGAHPVSDVEALLRGAAALPQAAQGLPADSSAETDAAPADSGGGR